MLNFLVEFSGVLPKDGKFHILGGILIFEVLPKFFLSVPVRPGGGNRNHLANVTPTRKPDDSKPFVSFVLTERSQTPGTTQNAL